MSDREIEFKLHDYQRETLKDLDFSDLEMRIIITSHRSGKTQQLEDLKRELEAKGLTVTGRSTAEDYIARFPRTKLVTDSSKLAKAIAQSVKMIDERAIPKAKRRYDPPNAEMRRKLLGKKGRF